MPENIVDIPEGMRLHAEWWWCEDEVCNCHQPRIVMRSIHRYGTPGWKPPLIVDKGPFRSGPEADDWNEMVAWMVDACKKYGLEFENPPGWKVK